MQVYEPRSPHDNTAELEAELAAIEREEEKCTSPQRWQASTKVRAASKLHTGESRRSLQSARSCLVGRLRKHPPAQRVAVACVVTTEFGQKRSSVRNRYPAGGSRKALPFGTVLPVGVHVHPSAHAVGSPGGPPTHHGLPHQPIHCTSACFGASHGEGENAL